MIESLKHLAFLKPLQPIKYRLLLCTLLLLSILTPLVESSSIAKLIHLILLQIALLACIVAVYEFRVLFWISLVLGLLALSDSSLEYLDGDPQIHTSALLITSLFFVILGVTILYDVMRSTKVNAEQICGALCVYFLIGVVWSYLFGVLLTTDANAIRFPESDAPRSHLPGTLTYFSFVTLTTLGYGDIQPVSLAARTLCWLEAVIGQIYMTVLIARLVGLNLSSHRDYSPTDQ